MNPYVPPPHDRGSAEGAPSRGSGPEPPRLLFIGRLVREKGIFDLLDAFSIVSRQHPCHLMIAGVGPAENEVRRRIELLGLARQTTLLGYVSGDALKRAYRSADIFVLPSHREGFPLSVMEAMGYRLPVVTTPIRGCADHLAPDVNAVFVPPRDPEALAGGLLRLLGDAALRSRMGAANSVKVLDFAPDAVIPRYVEILRGVALDGRRASR